MITIKSMKEFLKKRGFSETSTKNEWAKGSSYCFLDNNSFLLVDFDKNGEVENTSADWFGNVSIKDNSLKVYGEVIL